MACGRGWSRIDLKPDTLNDILLSSLLNLFALFGAVNNTDRKRSIEILSSYLTKHFGVRALDDYISLYKDLREYYDEFPELDKDSIIESICSSIKHKISKEDQTLMLLRFMEFCDPTPGSAVKSFVDEENQLIFKKVSDLFGISDSVFEDFLCYVSGSTNSSVITLTRSGLDGEIRIINLKEYNKILFSYHGKSTLLLNDIPVLPGTFLLLQQSGVLKSQNMPPLYYSNIASLYTKAGEERDIILACRDVNFRFRKSDNGMHDLSFTLKDGQLVAVMGGSGVGKSTLLSLLNGNIEPQSGRITLNGHDLSEPEVKDLIGYVPQDDLLIEELTVYQNLLFTARLCFSGLDEEEIHTRVDNILKDLGLEAIKYSKVGSPINKFISGGERKRLNIALELIREPAVLFLDEPTSGLSSSDSEKVVNLLKEQTFKGRLIITVIHQPSSDIFKLFDRLWILDKGGYPIYDGNPIEAITYFKRAADYADSEVSTCSLCGNVNPEIILNIVDEKTLDDSGRITGTRKVSPREWHKKYLGRAYDRSVPAKTELPESEQKRPSRFKQFQIFLKRNAATKMADAQYMFITLLEAPVLAVIVALLTRYAPVSGYTVMDNKNLVSYIFMAVIVAIFLGMSASAEEIFRDRALLKREKFLRLSYSSYIWSKIVMMAAISLIQSFLFLIVGNVIMGIGFQFITWWILLFISSLLANLIGLVLSQSLNSIVSIYITIPLLLIPQILLCGLVVKFEDLTPRSETGNVPVAGDFIPSRWAFEALAVNSFAYNDYEGLIFEDEKEKFKSLYYREAVISELESRLESARYPADSSSMAEDLETVRNTLPSVWNAYGLESFSGLGSLNVSGYDSAAYEAAVGYLAYARDTIASIGTRYTLSADRTLTEYIAVNGKDKLLRLKKDNYNLFLESLVLGPVADAPIKIVGNTVVPNAGRIFLDPVSRNGRAPFYSSVKIMGTVKINTMYFNTGVLLLMCILVSIALFCDFPGRYVRKKTD